jgi:uncharacterized YccA/Bax inhibitor family protein
MQFTRSANPTLNVFERPRWADLDAGGVAGAAAARPAAMTMRGTIVASATLLSLCAISAVLSWQAMTAGLFGATLSPTLAFFGGMLGGLGLGLVICLAPKTAPFLAPVHAVVQGAFVAGISLFITMRWLGGAENPAAAGMIFQAVVLTFAIAAAVLIAYGTGLVRGGRVFRSVAIAGGLGLLLYVAALWIGNGLFGANIPNLYASASPIGIGFTVICLVLASMYLVLDFRMIDEAIKGGAPRHMEWFAGFALLVTLVWIYIEVLRLLMKLRSGD